MSDTSGEYWNEEDYCTTMWYVHDTVETEGFDYAFCEAESFELVDDEEFHTLRKEYLKAKSRLENYLQKDYNARIENGKKKLSEARERLSQGQE